MENFTCQVTMETSRATEKIYAEWSAPSLHQMPCVSRIPFQAVQATQQGWRLTPSQVFGPCLGMHASSLEMGLSSTQGP